MPAKPLFEGTDEVKDGDIVYFICPKENIDFIKQESGKTAFNIHNVMIMGGSHIAHETMKFLPSNITTKIIEMDREKCYALAEKFSNSLIIQGDGRNMDLLKEEGIEDMDAFIAVTGNSEANVLACMAAKRLNVKRTVAEVENIDYIELAENLDTAPYQQKLIAAKPYLSNGFGRCAECNFLTIADALVVEFSERGQNNKVRLEHQTSFM